MTSLRNVADVWSQSVSLFGRTISTTLVHTNLLGSWQPQGGAHIIDPIVVRAGFSIRANSRLEAV